MGCQEVPKIALRAKLFWENKDAARNANLTPECFSNSRAETSGGVQIANHNHFAEGHVLQGLAVGVLPLDVGFSCGVAESDEPHIKEGQQVRFPGAVINPWSASGRGDDHGRGANIPAEQSPILASECSLLGESPHLRRARR